MSFEQNYIDFALITTKELSSNMFISISEANIIKHLNTNKPIFLPFYDIVKKLGGKRLFILALLPYYTIIKSDAYNDFLRRKRQSIIQRSLNFELGMFQTFFTKSLVFTMIDIPSFIFKSMGYLGTTWVIREFLQIPQPSLKKIIDSRSISNHILFGMSFILIKKLEKFVKMKRKFSYNKILDKTITYEQDPRSYILGWANFSKNFLMVYPLKVLGSVFINLWLDSSEKTPLDAIKAFFNLFATHGILGIYSGSHSAFHSSMICLLIDTFRIAILD